MLDTLVMPFELWRVLLNDADLELAQSSASIPEPYQPWIDKLDLGSFTLAHKVTLLYEDTLPQGEWDGIPGSTAWGYFGLCPVVTR